MLVKEPAEIPNRMKTKNQTRSFCMNPKVINAPCLLHLLLKRRHYFVLFLAKFVI
jgi:hypothetical protein